ncbi:uracil phosphoribosyltransferase, partial [Arthrospira platensis SPKY1]|nr:uracil phosphoribosyltransferase [Arthrospira platensis SPKY1]
VLRHLIGILRNKDTDMATFRETANRISRILAVYATAHLPEINTEVETPLQRCSQKRIVTQIIACPILRAGLAMLDAFLDLHPNSRVFHIGLKRDESTHQPIAYYRNFEHADGDTRVFLLDPMLATGGSL